MGSTIIPARTLRLAPEKNQMLAPAMMMCRANPTLFHFKLTIANKTKTNVNNKYWKKSMKRFSQMDLEYQPSWKFSMAPQ